MTSNSPILSIVVPISRMAGKLENLKKWVETAPESSVEIILVHDYKDNDTAIELEEIQDSWSKLKDNVRLYTVNFGNPGETRNYGLDHASGNWIQFVDSDDYIDVGESLRAIMRTKNHTEVIITNYQTIDFETKFVEPQFHHSDLRRVAMNPGIWRMIFRKNSITDTRFTKHRLGEDQLFLLDFDLFCRNIDFSEIQTYSYYLGVPNQLTSRRDLARDLRKVMERAHQSIDYSPKNEKRFIAIMLLRLVFTITKLDSLTLDSLRILKTAIKKLNWRDSFFLIQTLLTRLGKS